MTENNEKSTYNSLEETIEVIIEKREQEHKTAIQYKKHKRICKYIDELEVFTISKLYRLIKSSGEKITDRTVSDFLDTLYIENFLDLEIIETKWGKSAHLYSKKNIDPDKLQRAIDKLVLVNLEEKQKDQNSTIHSKTYIKHRKQSADHKKARADIAEEEQLEIEASNIQKLETSKEYREKLDHSARKKLAKKQKQQKKK